jgi:hypothetical protein
MSMPCGMIYMRMQVPRDERINESGTEMWGVSGWVSFRLPRLKERVDVLVVDFESERPDKRIRHP